MQFKLKTVQVIKIEPALKDCKEMADFILPQESPDKDHKGRHIIGKIQLIKRIREYFEQADIILPEGFLNQELKVGDTVYFEEH